MLAEAEYEILKNEVSPNFKGNLREVKSKTTVILWQCSLGHDYSSHIVQKLRGHGCPYCSGRKVYTGFNDFKTKYPEVAKFWSPLNVLDPSKILVSRSERFLWRCTNGEDHNFKARISKMIVNSSCMVCKNYEVLSGFNDINTFSSEAYKWFSAKNSATVEQSVFNSTKKYKWHCVECDYEWKADAKTIANRISKKKNACPICTGVVADGKNTLGRKFPELLEEWDFEKNFLDPFKTSGGSKEKAWWKCSNGHSYEKQISYKTKSPKTPCVKCNSLAFRCPDFAEEYSLKNEIAADAISYKSARMVIWLCKKCNGEYKRTPGIKHKSPECPYCTDWQILKGFNDFATVHKDLLKFWDYDKNSLGPTEYSKNSSKSVWWKCDGKFQHSFRARIAEFIEKEDKCAYCAKRRTDLSEKTLLSVVPEIEALWSKKNMLHPSELSPYTSQKVILECQQGHVFERSCNKITHRSANCPYCTNVSFLKGFNDLATKKPELLEFWDYEKNEEDPSDVKVNSINEYYWKCSKGHSIVRSCQSVMYGFSCPHCVRSSIEVHLNQFLKRSTEFNIRENVRNIIGLELDFYIDALNKAIEVNGDYWHSDDTMLNNTGMTSYDYHLKKKRLCEEKGIELIFVWEYDWKHHRAEVEENVLKWLNNEQYDTHLFSKFNSVTDKPELYS